MKIAVVGAGSVGTLYAERWLAAGHKVVLTYTRSEEQLRIKAAALGASAAGPSDAVTSADIVLFCPPYELIDDAAAQLGSLTGRLVIDTVNPFKPDRSGVLDLPKNDTAFRAVAEALPGVRHVKAFHNLAVGQVTDNPAAQPVIFVAGDDADSRNVVSALVTNAGLTPIQTGDLESARLSEAPGPLFMRLMDAAEAKAALAQQHPC